MQTIQVTVPFKEGLHARPATELVKVCMTIKSDITLIRMTLMSTPRAFSASCRWVQHTERL